MARYRQNTSSDEWPGGKQHLYFLLITLSQCDLIRTRSDKPRPITLH